MNVALIGVRFLGRTLWWLFALMLTYLAAAALLSVIQGAATLRDDALGGTLFVPLLLLELTSVLPVLLMVATLGAMGESRLAKAGYYILGLLVCSLFSFGWSHYSYAGRFPGVDTVLFYLKSPIHLLEHALDFSPITLLFVVVVTMVTSVVLLLGLASTLKRVTLKIRVYVLLGGTAVFSLLAYTYSPLEMLEVRDSELGSMRLASRDPSLRAATVGDYLEDLLLNRSGPFTSLVLPSRRVDNRFTPNERLLEVTYNERISVAAYAEQVRLTNGERLDLPNVIVVLIESLRADEVNLGGADATMPNLEMLIDNGLFFNSHYTSSSHSSYADISVISGLYPLWGPRIYLYPDTVVYPRPRLYDVLGATGYRSGIFSSQNENWGGMLNYLKSDYLDAIYHTGDFITGERLLDRAIQLNSGKGFDVDTVDVALAWLKPAQQSAFAYINFQGSHYPYYFPDSETRPFGADFDGRELNFLNIPTELIPVVRPRYRDSLYYVDKQLGRLVEGLKVQGQWENTLLIVTGDTGQAFGEHGFTGHARDLYDEVVRTPLIISGGYLKQRGEDGRLSHHVDIAPTVLDLLALPEYDGFQGVSLLGPTKRLWAPLVCQSPAQKQLAIVTHDYKLLYDWDVRAVKGFDLQNDPLEQRPLSTNHSDINELNMMLDTWISHQMNYYSKPQQHSRFFAPAFNHSILPSVSE